MRSKARRRGRTTSRPSPDPRRSFCLEPWTESPITTRKVAVFVSARAATVKKCRLARKARRHRCGCLHGAYMASEPKGAGRGRLRQVTNNTDFSGAPDKIRTCDLCLRRGAKTGDHMTKPRAFISAPTGL